MHTRSFARAFAATLLIPLSLCLPCPGAPETTQMSLQ